MTRLPVRLTHAGQTLDDLGRMISATARSGTIAVVPQESLVDARSDAIVAVAEDRAAYIALLFRLTYQSEPTTEGWTFRTNDKVR